jgi:hypothetical protein
MMKISSIRPVPRAVALRLGLLSALVLALPGCFRYVPAQLETTPPGTAARVVVTRAGSEQLREVLPDGRDGDAVRGTFVERDGNTAILSVPVAQRQDGMAQRSIQQRIQVPIGEIVSFERREVNVAGTAILAGGVAGFATVILLAITEARKGDNPDNGIPPDESIISIPLFSFLWSR